MSAPGITTPTDGIAQPSLQEVHKARQYFRQNESHVRSSKMMLSLAQRSGSLGVKTNSHIDASIWSALEDRVIMKAEDLKSDAVALYSSHHKSNPNQFPKAGLSEIEIRSRLLELRSQPRRLKLLKCIPDEALNAAINPESPAGSPANRHGVVQTGLPKVSRVTMGGDNGSTGRSSVAPGGDPFNLGSGTGAVDDLVIRCLSRGGVDHDEIPANEESLCQQSPYLANVLGQAALPINDLGLRVVELDESATMWKDIQDMHRVFAPDNVLRFVQFCRKPEMLDAKLVADEKLKKAKAEQGKDWAEFVVGIKAAKTAQVEELKVKAQEELDAVRSEFTTSMEADLQCVRQIYAAHVDRELELLQVQQQQRLDATSRFFEDELQTLESVSMTVETPQVAELTQEAARADGMIDAVFTREGLPRLLMLADVLRSSDLRTACTREISKAVQHFGANRQMRSDLLRHGTITELLAKVEDVRLSSLVKMKDRCGFPESVVKEEWNLRQQAVKAECQNLGTVELMDKWKKLPPDYVWQQIIYSVLESRQKSYKAEASSRSFVVPKTQLRLVEIGTSTIEVIVPFQYVTAELRLGLKVGEGVRKGFWECRVPFLSRGSSLVIGFECAAHRRPATPAVQGAKVTSSPRAASVSMMSLADSIALGSTGDATTWVDKESPLGTAPSPTGGYGCGLSNEGLLYVRGSIEDARGGFFAGDVIGVGIDQLTGTMIFTRNGTLMSMPRNLIAQVSGMEEVVPCISMYGTNLADLGATGLDSQVAVGDDPRAEGRSRNWSGMSDVGGHKLVKVAVETEREFTHIPPSGYRPLSAIAKPLLES